MRIRHLFLLTAFLLFAIESPVYAQSTELPVYIVQPGDTLYTIAYQFNLTVDDILEVNELLNPDWLSEGDEIRIPGFDGISGEFVPYTIGLEDNYNSILHQTIVDEQDFILINQLTSPNELIAGKDIILPVSAAEENVTPDTNMSYHSPLLSLSAIDSSYWENDFDGLIGNVLNKQEIAIANLTIDPFPFQQGHTSFIHFDAGASQNLQLLIDNTITPVYEYEPGKYFAMYSLNALSEIGQREILLETLGADKTEVIYSQNILANDSAYPTDPVIVVEESYIDPVNTMPEEEELFAMASNITQKDLWDGSLTFPVDEPCFRSYYGSIRSYNNGPYDNFHTGLDFGVCADNLNIYAAGSGRVVHAGQWFVRGNSVVIDHGWGVYTGYWHMDSIDVNVGDIVQEGQQIGIIGNTGRSTGAHLHLEVMINDVQVDPLQWMEVTIP
jgi:murein DD-endopeptidase MepM/ murein hydrolase activator NlpD